MLYVRACNQMLCTLYWKMYTVQYLWCRYTSCGFCVVKVRARACRQDSSSRWEAVILLTRLSVARLSPVCHPPVFRIYRSLPVHRIGAPFFPRIYLLLRLTHSFKVSLSLPHWGGGGGGVASPWGFCRFWPWKAKYTMNSQDIWRGNKNNAHYLKDLKSTKLLHPTPPRYIWCKRVPPLQNCFTF